MGIFNKLFGREPFAPKPIIRPQPKPNPNPEAYAMLPDGKRDVSYGVSAAQRLDQDLADKLRILRNARYKGAHPNWVEWQDAMELKDYPLDPEHVHKFGVFRNSIPKRTLHWDSVQADGKTGAWYTIVSADWKAALESVEPNVHQFFRYELRLHDGTVIGSRFIFHITQRVGFIDKTASGYTPHQRDDGIIYYTKPFVYTGPAMQNLLAINRKAIAGHHLWLDQDEGILLPVAADGGGPAAAIATRTGRFSRAYCVTGYLCLTGLIDMGRYLVAPSPALPVAPQPLARSPKMSASGKGQNCLLLRRWRREAAAPTRFRTSALRLHIGR